MLVTSDYTSQTSTLSQSLTGLGQNLSLRLCQLLPNFSMTTQTSHHKQGPSPSRSSWLRLKRRKVNDEVEKEGEAPRPGPQQEEIDLHEHLHSKPHPMPYLVRERIQQNQTQEREKKKKDLINDRNSNHQTCHGTGKGVSQQAHSTQAASSLQISSNDSTKTSNQRSYVLDSPWRNSHVRMGAHL